VLESAGLGYTIQRADNVIRIDGAGEIIFRTMDTPERIVGYEVADSLVDELDTLPTDKAKGVWQKLLARNRQRKPDGAPNTAAVATTPEGFRFVYERWGKSPPPGYKLIRASTLSNARNLSDGYIQSLRDSYPENLLAAYLDGEFVNLTSGSVYRNYDRKLNACSDTVQDGEPIFVGMDFNVGRMAAVIHVKRNGEPRAVAEISDGFDTPAMIRMLKERYWGRSGGDYVRTRDIRVFPDASGGSRKSVNASTTDIQLLRHAGFAVIAPQANPPVKDRVNAMNAAFCNANGERRYLVNADLCPAYADDLEQQVWGPNGEPDKTAGKDHRPDAAGYFIYPEYPIVRPVSHVNIGFARG
jgi:hypothetical protein